MSYIADKTRYSKIEYRNCGESGLKLPAVSLGLWHNFGDNSDFENMKKMGNIADLVSMIPGMNGLKISEKDIDEARIERFKAIIKSMTPSEREKPEIIKSSRRVRIANGSGTSIQDVNQLLKQFEQSKKMMKQMSGMFGGKKRGGFKLPFGF